MDWQKLVGQIVDASASRDFKLMNEIWYTCRGVFSAATRMDWDKYVAWAQLPQLCQVVSLDSFLCPDVINELNAEDWQYNVQADYFIFMFRDLDYLLERVRDVTEPFDVLAVCHEPDADARTLFDDARFEFMGYDLMDEWVGDSALTNCGGFPEAFDNSELSEVGLLRDFAQANIVQQRLREFYADEPHANCDVWAIWKLKRVR
jgi:hypothetical protein